MVSKPYMVLKEGRLVRIKIRTSGRMTAKDAIDEQVRRFENARYPLRAMAIISAISIIRLLASETEVSRTPGERGVETHGQRCRRSEVASEKTEKREGDRDRVHPPEDS